MDYTNYSAYLHKSEDQLKQEAKAKEAKDDLQRRILEARDEVCEPEFRVIHNTRTGNTAYYKRKIKEYKSTTTVTDVRMKYSIDGKLFMSAKEVVQAGLAESVHEVYGRCKRKHSKLWNGWVKLPKI